MLVDSQGLWTSLAFFAWSQGGCWSSCSNVCFSESLKKGGSKNSSWELFILLCLYLHGYPICKGGWKDVTRYVVAQVSVRREDGRRMSDRQSMTQSGSGQCWGCVWNHEQQGGSQCMGWRPQGRCPGFLPSLTFSDPVTSCMLSLRHFSEEAGESEKSTECRIRRCGYKF